MTSRRQFNLGASLGIAGLWLPEKGCAQEVPLAPVGFTGASGYQLVKDWNFKTLIRDPVALREEFRTRYIYGNGTLDHLNDEWSRYRDNENHVFTSNGLSLVARAVGDPAPGTVESGMLRSIWSGEYGVFEVCMKVPSGLGLLSAFWLNPEDLRWPPEIDVAEIINNGRDTTSQSYHFLKGIGENDTETRYSVLSEYQSYTPGFDFASGFHVCSVEWTPDTIRNFVDGVLIADREYYWYHDDASDAGPAHVIVNLGVGGDWLGSPGGPEAFPASLEIEYIRAWQR